MIDFIIVLIYFTVVLLVALNGKINNNSSADEYFLSSRNLPWYSIALSTIATNIQGYQFLGMMGSAYLYGCLLYTSPSPRDATLSRMPSSA
mgnify:CR=1 FL=1